MVGLGVYGLAITEALTRAGFEVHGFEQFELRHDRGSSHGASRIFRLWPGEGAQYAALAQEAASHWGRLARSARIPILHWGGALIAGREGSAFVEESQALAAEAGAAAEDLDLTSDDVRRRFNVTVPRAWRACFQVKAGRIASDTAIEAISASIQAAGGRLHTGVRIRITDRPNCLKIDGRLEAFDRIIVAAGPWVKDMSLEGFTNLQPVQKTLGWYELDETGVGGEVAADAVCLDDACGLFAVREGEALKVGLDARGAELSAPDEVDAAAMKDDVERLSAAVGRFFSGYKPNPVRTQRCLYTLSSDLNFLVDFVPGREDVLVASCCSGHGFKYAPAIAAEIAEWARTGQLGRLQSFALRNRVKPAHPIGD